MNSSDSIASDQTHSSVSPHQEDPGAYPIPFSTDSVKLGSRLDSIPVSLRFWAVRKDHAGNSWYNDMVAANDRYEEWLSTQPPEEYPVPFSAGKVLDDIEDKFRAWGVNPNRSSAPWYNFFVRANARYEQHLNPTRSPGKFPLPYGISNKYAGVPIEDVPQDSIWWVLRPSNSHQDWYQRLYDANERFLDDVYKSRSPRSELLWFGKYRGHRLDQVYARKGYIRRCFSPKRDESGRLYRFKDLVRRLQDWRLAHPERCGPRRRRKVPDTQNPVGEAIGPWDDSLGSADEDDYDKDSFVQSDNDELEYSDDVDDDHDEEEEEELMEDGGTDSRFSEDSDESTSFNVEMVASGTHARQRRRTNVIQSDDESEPEESGASVRKLGKRYRVWSESSEEGGASVRKSFGQRH